MICYGHLQWLMVQDIRKRAYVLGCCRARSALPAVVLRCQHADSAGGAGGAALRPMAADRAGPVVVPAAVPAVPPFSQRRAAADSPQPPAIHPVPAGDHGLMRLWC